MDNSATIIKYADLFGTSCTFYNDKMPKLYTVVGGILSIFSILVCIIIFIIFSLDDLKRKFPNTAISSIPNAGYRKIKFSKEKIWIPWRITDYNNNEFINHTGLLYPIITYYSGIKFPDSKEYNYTKKILNYKLCNETSLIHENNIYQITVPLNELYCIDMEDLDIGGSWMSEFISYIEFDLYYCENGINYDETNSKCTTFDKIIKYAGENNSLDISIYFPIVQFQPINKTSPLIVIYREFYYHLSKYVYKINRIFLQENVFTDDSGWILKTEKNNSYWGINSINGDTYYRGNENDLMNEGSNSRAYSFNIYLEPGIIHYKRNYKKIHTIFSDFYPVAYIIFVIMKNISKLFKMAENNKKMIELLFENLKEKPNVFEKNIQKLRLRNYNSINNCGRLSFHSYINRRKAENKINNINNNETNGINKDENNEDNDSYNCNIDNNANINNTTLKKPKEKKPSIPHLSILLDKNAKKNSLSKSPQNSFHQKSSKFNNQQKSSFLNIINNTSNQNLIPIEPKFKSNINFERTGNNYQELKLSQVMKPKIYIKEKLFPYKYYLFSVFIKNLKVSNENLFFSSKFAKIYTFLCQLFDIATYISLQREFNALKTIVNDKSIQLIEKNPKININSNSFIKDINQCIGEQKFYILAQGMNNKKSKDNII